MKGLDHLVAGAVGSANGFEPDVDWLDVVDHREQQPTDDEEDDPDDEGAHTDRRDVQRRRRKTRKNQECRADRAGR